MSETEQASNESVESLITGLVAARAEVLRTERSLRQTLMRLEDGRTSLDEFILDIRPCVECEELDHALDAVNELRRQARVNVFSLALERGHSIAEMARSWGVSRQLASRYVHEALRVPAGEKSGGH